MRKLRNSLTTLLLASVAFFTVSCDNNDEIKVNPDSQFDVVLKVTKDSSDHANVNYNVTSATGSSILAKVRFNAGTNGGMKRLYITQNALGTAETKFTISGIDSKGDGSVDLEKGDGKTFEYQFTLPVPADLKTQNGTLVYTLWATSGIGDFRNSDKRLILGPATITLKFGTAVDPDVNNSAVKSYPDVKLFAPTADGNSKTFVSLVDGKTYNVSQGVEFVSLWDFGYLYSVSAKDSATLRAPFNYNVPYSTNPNPITIIDIPAKSGTTNDDLNKTYFKLSAKTASDFDNVAKFSDLASVSVTATNETVRITRLDVGNVVEFVDNYGKKGLIKVLEIQGTNGSDAFIRIAIKVQP
jgi:hypothetical protein